VAMLDMLLTFAQVHSVCLLLTSCYYVAMLDMLLAIAGAQCVCFTCY